MSKCSGSGRAISCLFSSLRLQPQNTFSGRMLVLLTILVIVAGVSLQDQNVICNFFAVNGFHPDGIASVSHLLTKIVPPEVSCANVSNVCNWPAISIFNIPLKLLECDPMGNITFLQLGPQWTMPGRPQQITSEIALLTTLTSLYVQNKFNRIQLTIFQDESSILVRMTQLSQPKLDRCQICEHCMFSL